MALSIRNRETERLARDVALETGENLTEAITEALRERLERLRGRRTATDRAREIMEISQRCASLPDLDRRDADEILGYGSDGALS